MNLTAGDYKTFERLRIPRELVDQVGILRVTDQEARETYGIKGGGDMSGFVIPYWEPSSMANGQPWRRWYARVRRDHPDDDGKRKYVAPYGDKRHFYFPPVPHWFSDASVPIVLVEAEKSSLALLAWAQRTGRKILPLAIGGCWAWRGKVGIATTATGERVPDHDVLLDLHICRDGRRTLVLLDSNASSNPQVAAARAALVKQLQKQNAIVAVIDLPYSEGVNGPDDYVGTMGDEAMARLLDGADEGQKILDDVQRFIRRFVVISDAQSIAITLWIAHTHCFAASSYTPYLAITSATKRAGKSRLMETISYLVHEPWYVSGASAASLFREIDQRRPTLLLDEIDTIFKGDKEMGEAVRAVLNAGNHTKGVVSRVIGKGEAMTSKNFSCFCPKALAGIGHLADTVADRALQIRLERKLSNQPTERLRERLVGPHAAELRGRLAKWINNQSSQLKHAEPELPNSLNDRQQDGAEPLLAIADTAGGNWPTDSRKALVEISAGDESRDESHQVQLLTDIKIIFARSEKMFSSDLVDSLKAIETSPWADWAHGRGLTKVALARQLKEFRIYPKTIRIGDEHAKGYGRDSFIDAWERYLPLESVTTRVTFPTPNVTTEKSEESSVNTRGVTPVTDETGGRAGKRCYVHGNDGEFWQQPSGEWTCAICHPPPWTSSTQPQTEPL